MSPSLMKNRHVLFTAVSALALLGAAGCATAVVRVLPGENGAHRISARDIEKDGAEVAAVKAAKKYCEKKDMEAVFTKEEARYEGKMDEETRKTVRNASKAAAILGGTGYGVSGGDSKIAGVLGGAGTVGTAMTSDRDYVAEVEFKCVRE